VRTDKLRIGSHHLLIVRGELPEAGMIQDSPVVSIGAGLARSLRIQSLAVVLLTLVLLLVSPVAAYSSLFGGLTVYLPGLVFTLLVVRKIGQDSAAFLGTAALAEFGKLVLTGVLCAVVFIWIKPLAAGFFFLGMISALIASWVGLGLVFRGR
jgi:F0F1-type ATP synthase assembly protein I